MNATSSPLATPAALFTRLRLWRPEISSETLIHLHPEEIAIIFPGELHRPMSSLGAGAPLRKIIIKINSALI